MIAVYNWVIKNTRYVALEFGIYGFKPRRCVQTVNRGWGDCKDKATVIVTLLRELGIDAHLVLVRTRTRGKFRSDLPSLAPFDHAIAYVPSLDLYLDGTAEYTGAFELPVMDRKAMGLLILDGKAKRVTLPGSVPENNVIERTIRVALARDGSARMDLSQNVRGFAAARYRARYEAKATRKDRLAQDLGREYPGLEIDPGSLETNDLSDVEQPVSIDLEGKISRFARPEGSQLSVPVALNVQLTPTYASLSERSQDVVINGFSSRKQTAVIQLPQGARVVASPPDINEQSQFGSFSVQVTQNEDEVTVESALALKVTRVAPKDYAKWRSFCQAVDEAMSRRLVVQP